MAGVSAGPTWPECPQVQHGRSVHRSNMAGVFTGLTWPECSQVQHGRSVRRSNMAGVFAGPTWPECSQVQHGRSVTVGHGTSTGSDLISRDGQHCQVSEIFIKILYYWTSLKGRQARIQPPLNQVSWTTRRIFRNLIVYFISPVPHPSYPESLRSCPSGLESFQT